MSALKALVIAFYAANAQSVSECTEVTMSGFYWSEVNGPWDLVDGVVIDDQPVFQRYCYGDTTYLWSETYLSWTIGGYDSAWVTGFDYNKNSFWEWKWGD